jgi:hypothetical protein
MTVLQVQSLPVLANQHRHIFVVFIYFFYSFGLSLYHESSECG